MLRFSLGRVLLLLTLGLGSPAFVQPQTTPSTPARETNGRLILVLPFDNRSGQPNLSWIGDSFPDTLSQRFLSAGFLTIARDDLQYALDHLGLPADFKPTRATTIRIAQTLDADFVVVGNFNIHDGRIAVQSQVLALNKLKLSASIDDSSELTRLFDVENAVAWKVARQIDPHFAVAQQTFLAASGDVRLSAFESYIRGTSATNPQERIKRLQAAVQAAPNYPAALLALGKAQFAERQYDQAAATLAKVPHSNRLALEAGFYLGLARFNSAKYADAEAAFAFVASKLPLPEVINNQAVSASRQGKDAVALFRRASAADPNDADYHYNIAVALLRKGESPAALAEVNQALKLHASDSEAVQLRAKASTASPAASAASAAPTTTTTTAKPPTPAAPEEVDFLERIRRTYSEASFRQAAFQLDEMRSLRMATLPPAEQATQYTQLGSDYLAQGLVPEAESEFQAAITADQASSAAHVGLAQVREQSGAAPEARSEAQLSLKLQPNVSAYLVLARLDLQAKDLPAAATDVSNALHLEPRNSAALGMKQALLSRGQALP